MTSQHHEYDVFDAIISMLFVMIFFMEVIKNPHNLIRIGLFTTLSLLFWMIIRAIGDVFL